MLHCRTVVFDVKERKEIMSSYIFVCTYMEGRKLVQCMVDFDCVVVPSNLRPLHIGFRLKLLMILFIHTVKSCALTHLV